MQPRAGGYEERETDVERAAALAKPVRRETAWNTFSFEKENLMVSILPSYFSPTEDQEDSCPQGAGLHVCNGCSLCGWPLVTVPTCRRLQYPRLVGNMLTEQLSFDHFYWAGQMLCKYLFNG